MKRDLIIFTDNVEPEAINQIYNLIAQPPFYDKKIRIMPDVHYGTNCVVGFTAELGNKIIPNVLGVDLGCGMLTVLLGKNDFSLQKLDDYIKENIPHGSNFRKEVLCEKLIRSLYCYDELVDLDRLYGSLGTLGGGNHFIEIDEDEEGNRYLIIHSGSRNLGLQVAKIYQKKAIDSCKNSAQAERENKIAQLKSQGKISAIPDAIAEINAKYAHKSKIPADFCYLDGILMENYMHDLKICQEFASLSRNKMAEEILKFLKITPIESFETVHNFIADDNVIRKGAIPAHKGQKVLIPMNMRDGCIIAVGKGNADWNFSAPHGAGRLLKRSVVKDYYTVEEFADEMKNVYTTTVNSGTLDESPMAYKPMQEILNLITPTVEVIKIIKPIYNFKSGT